LCEGNSANRDRLRRGLEDTQGERFFSFFLARQECLLVT
jgi:hypothetical protein